MSGTDWTRTPNLNLYKPVYDMDDGAWGGHLNSNADILDAWVGPGGTTGPWLPLAGGTMTGALILGSGASYGALTIGENYSFSTTAQSAIYENLTVAGAVTSGNAPSWNSININADSVNATAVVGANWFSVNGTASSGFTGNRTALGSSMFVYAPGAGQGYGFLTAMAAGVWGAAAAGANGTNTSLFGGLLAARLQPNASGFEGIVGLEIDMTAESGATHGGRTGLKIVRENQDAIAATGLDVAFSIVNQPSAATGWKTGIAFGDPTGVWGMAPSATLIGSLSTANGGPAYACSYGVDFNAITFSGAAWRSNGFTIHQSGGIDFGVAFASSATDVSRHINLYNGQFGINVTSGNVNIVGGSVVFYSGTTNAGYIDNTGLNNMTIGAAYPSAAHFSSVGMGSVLASSITDLSKHIALYGSSYGFNIGPAGNLGIVTNSAMQFICGGTNVGYVDSTGMNNVAVGAAYQSTGRFTTLQSNAGLGVFGSAPLGGKPTATGAKGGNAALASVLTILASYGLLTDSTT